MGRVGGIATEGRYACYFGAQIDRDLDSDKICGVK